VTVISLRCLTTFESGQLDSTIIVFTADHGELLGVHGMRGKGTFAAREQTRVPAVIVHPDGARGVECEALSSHIDLAPTLLSLAGVRPNEVREQMPMLVGQDLSALVMEPAASFNRPDGMLLHWTAILYQDHRNVRRFDGIRRMEPEQRPAAFIELMGTALLRRGQMRGVYDGRWKFLRYSAPHSVSQPTTLEGLLATHDIELYDTHSDPGETKNLATDPHKWTAEITDLNARVNRLIASEVGIDNGSFVPTFGIQF
jgi:arylsulfatase A-like enzyme